MIQRAFLLGILALILGATCGRIAPRPNDLEFLDVGQGDCAALRYEGVTILIDDGPVSHLGSGRQVAVTRALRRRGVDSVDLILLSHPDADHIGGTSALIAQCPGAKLLVSSQFRTQPKLLHSVQQWHLTADRILWLPAEADITIGRCSLHIECPPVTNREDDNRGSMFVHLDDEGATADFSGDAPMDVEKAEANHGSWRADILHAGHHGSRNSSSDDWIDAVHPRIAVISCGRDNPYGHPHRATLSRFQAHQIPVVRTDEEGDLVFAPVHGHFVRQ